MIHFERPARPSAFDTDEDIVAARQAVKDDIDAGKKPDFPEHWGKAEYKRCFMMAQHNRCGYCEREVSDTGQVEHYAPKSNVSDLIEPGKEDSGLPNVAGRKCRTISMQGYWWLAYDWDNYLIACERCNVGWKRTLFPVTELKRTLPPSQDVTETHLLLNPYNDSHFYNHFRFTELGQIQGITDRGRATIETCGLGRPSLAESRRPVVRDVLDILTDFGRDPTGALKRIVSHGSDDYQHAGVARAVVKARLDLDWELIVEAAS
jgi:hypothetical protein